MKKFLSLVLALVMTMSLVTVSAGAKDFTDNSKINYKEAVDVMSAAKVIDGYAEGDFRPANTLTRGAAAKIICNMILGPTTAGALVADAAPYSDVPTTNTFAGYIAYCAKEGIISGYADGTFRPAASLSGYAFMKMLLGALGYDATAEGYTGNNWSINVAKRALNVGLDDDLIGEFNGTKAVTREEACLYAFNTLKAPMVEYANSNSVTVNGITFTNKSDAKEIENKDKTGKNVIIKDDLLNFCEKYFTKLTVGSSKADDFGRPAHEWKYDKKSVGTYADDAKLTYTTGVKGTDLADDLDDADIKATGAVEIVRNGGLDKNHTANETLSKADLKAALKSSTKLGGNGIVLELFTTENSNGDDVLSRIVVTATYLAQVTKVTKDKASTKNTDERALTLKYADANGNDVTVSVDAEDDIDNFDAVYSKVEKDDYVLVVPKGDNTASKDVLAISVPDSVTGKVTKVNTSKGTVTVDGTTYDVAKVMADTFEVKKTEQTIYFDNYGYAIGGDDTVSGSSDVVYLVKVYDDTDKYGDHTYYAQIVTADGEILEIETNKAQYQSFISKEEDTLAKGVYTYETNDDDDAIFTAATSDEAVAIAADTKIKTSDAKVAGKYYADTVTFVYVNKSGAKLKVTTANGIQKIDKIAENSYAVLNDDGEVSTVFVGTKAATVVDKDTLVFVVNTESVGSAMDKDNKKKPTYEFWKDGEKQVEIVDFDAAASIGYYSYAENTDNGHFELTKETEDVYTVKLTRDADKKIVQINKDKFVTLNNKLQDRVLADDCTIYDTTDNDITTLSDIVSQVEDEGAKLNLGVVYDSDAEEITCIYVYER